MTDDLNDTSRALVDALTELGDEYGPLGVAIAAARLTDPEILCKTLSVHQRLNVKAHFMVPGSHERPYGPACNCGAEWDRWNDRCLNTQASTDNSPDMVVIERGSVPSWMIQADCVQEHPQGPHILLSDDGDEPGVNFGDPSMYTLYRLSTDETTED